MYNSPYAGVRDCVSTVFRQEGIRAFYRSYTTQLSMNIPFQVRYGKAVCGLRQFVSALLGSTVMHMLSCARLFLVSIGNGPWALSSLDCLHDR